MPATWRPRSASQNLDCRPARSASRRPPRGQPFECPSTRSGRLTEPEQFGDIIVKVGRGGPARRTAAAAPSNPRPGCTPASPIPLAERTPSAAAPNVPTAQTTLPQPACSHAADGTAAQHGDRRQRRPAAARPAAAATAGGGAMTGGGGRAPAAAARPAAAPAARTAARRGEPSAADRRRDRRPVDQQPDDRQPRRQRRPDQHDASGRGPRPPSAGIVRLRDVARVELGAQNYIQA